MPVVARAHEAEVRWATVADGQRAQIIEHASTLPPHLSSSAHEGRAAACRCRPLLDQLATVQQWPVAPRGTREACTAEQHELMPLRIAYWPDAPAALRLQALRGHVDITLTMCGWCGAVEVRDVSFHAPAGMAAGRLAPRRRSDVLGWYSGSRPAGRVYV